MKPCKFKITAFDIMHTYPVRHHNALTSSDVGSVHSSKSPELMWLKLIYIYIYILSVDLDLQLT